jgi:hypothetical protein
MFGRIHYEFRWGLPYMVTADTNLDGNINFRASFVGVGDFSFSPVEYWEDRDFDGVFEIHLVKDQVHFGVLQVDQDGDGIYDLELFGEEAKEYYRSLGDRENTLDQTEDGSTEGQ